MLEEIFARARAQGRSAFIPYIMAGDPDVETTQGILAGLCAAGADAVELGIPYGDPLADGPTIAAAGARSLLRGTSIADVLQLAAQSSTRHATPIILFTYFNPIYQYGIDRFARAAADAGVSGAIVPDIALEESGKLRSILASHGLQMPLLIAPSTKLERAARIAEESTGFLYVVSRMGVTGAGVAPDFSPLQTQLANLRTITTKPLGVGFGVSRVEHVREVAPLADGIIVGSALVNAYAGKTGAAAATAARTFVKPLIAAARR
ncbi:MAG: tryptophan synthase subunit alpha [Candidatus Eremiobacteraeota bacterium]|nr:tryptophan synthase subunit alpha [Candidatus Eremiobacteraeota bacterium]